LYGHYGPVASGEPPSSPLAYINSKAPPCFVAHGDHDTLVIVEDARHFAEQLRATSSNPVVYAQLPGAQHGFDVFRSRRFETVIDAIEAFAACVGSASGSTDHQPTESDSAKIHTPTVEPDPSTTK
jgi:acetyl esterase/lipase